MKRPSLEVSVLIIAECLFPFLIDLSFELLAYLCESPPPPLVIMRPVFVNVGIFDDGLLKTDILNWGTSYPPDFECESDLVFSSSYVYLYFRYAYFYEGIKFLILSSLYDDWLNGTTYCMLWFVLLFDAVDGDLPFLSLGILEVEKF